VGNSRTNSFAAARMAYRYPWQVSACGLTTTALGLGIDQLGWSDPAVVMVPGGLTAYAGASGWWWFKHVARPHSTKALIARRAELDQRSAGVATRLDIAEHAGPKALRLKAPVLRPSFAGLNRRERRRIPLRDLGVEIARLGWGWWGERVYSSCEDATLRVAGPRAGKTLSLACHGLDAPGALITTSTRLDLAEMVHQVRAGRGRVHVFNPAGLGDLPSTVRWRVLDGCEDFATAQRRARDLVPESTGEAQRWDDQARRILALLLNAAATTGRSMRDVMRWIHDPAPASRDEVTDALLSTPGEGARDRAAAYRAHWATNDRTKSSITSTMAVPLAWMADDRARTLGDATPTDPGLLDVTRLIERGETLHLIGHEDQSGLSPLIGAVVSEIAHAARTLAAKRPGGRLDPPLTMLLDEAALVCPVPLDRWTADMGGRGVTLHICAQSLSQLRQRWGDDGAGTIIANVTSFLWFGGSPSSDDLADISRLTGEHRMKVTGPDHQHDSADDGERRGEYRWVPVLSPAQIRALAPFQVLILRRGLNTTVGWAPTVLNRRGWAPSRLHPSATGGIEATIGAVPSAAQLEAMLDDDTRPDTQPTTTPTGGSVLRRILPRTSRDQT
jgi:type IV secretion system protein VirD4